MKFSIQCLFLFAVRTVVAMPPPIGALQSVDRALASSTGHSLANSGILTNAAKTFTVETAEQELHRAVRGGEFNPLQSPEFQEFLKDSSNAEKLYDRMKRSYIGPASPEMLEKLKVIAFGGNLPKRLDSASQIISVVHRKETADILSKTDVFKAYINDLPKLQELVIELRKLRRDPQRFKDAYAWNELYPNLKMKLYTIWYKKLLADKNVVNSPLFQSFLRDNENARALFLTFRPLNMPEVTSLLKDKAYSPVIAQFNKMNNFDQAIDLVKVLRDDQVLDLLEHSDRYKKIINDPFQAYLLNLKIPAIPKQDTSFYQRLRFASERNFEGSSDVLETLRNWERLQRSRHFEDLYNFKPYTDFISDESRAMELLNRVSADPQSFPKFIKEPRLFPLLKEAAYKSYFPREETTAEKIAKSFVDLKRVGLSDRIKYSKGYIKFVGARTDNHIAILDEMEKIGIPETDKDYLEVMNSAVRNSLFDMVQSKGVEANSLLEKLLLTKQGVRFLKQGLNFRIGGIDLEKEIEKQNPIFIARFRNAAAGLD